MKQVEIKRGVKILFQDQAYVITRILSIESILAENIKTRIPEKLEVNQIRPFEEKSDVELKPERYWDTLTEKQKNIAEHRFQIIEPLLDKWKGDGLKVREIADREGIHFSTIYKWINKYESTGQVSSLTDEDGRGGKGKGRLSAEVEKVIQEAIADLYFGEDFNQEDTCVEIIKQCETAGLETPSKNTIRNRIANLTEYERLRGKKGKKAADHKYGHNEGSLEAERPLDVVQIDHSLLNVKVVDDVYRLPLGRPWLTLAFDVCCRMPLGIYLSLDTPGNTGTGLCLANAILPKESYLASLELNTQWPCWGTMKKIHADNAKEFRGKMLKEACREYNIDLQFRPVKKPNYGGHIERMMGTFKQDISKIPGSTNKDGEGEYDSDGYAVMTLFELEQWLVTYITKVFVHKFHNGINTSPIKKWTELILGNAKIPGAALPPRFLDESKLKLDFLPFETRTIQDYGVSIDKIHYFSDVLRKYINSTDSASGKYKIKRKFIFKRDLRDISKVYFFEPELKRYFEVPYGNLSGPKMSIWEYREVITRLIIQGKKEINEDMIFEGIKELRAMVENSKTKTKKTRRHHAREQKLKREPPLKLPSNTDHSQQVEKPIKEKRTIKPFTDISYGSLE